MSLKKKIIFGFLVSSVIIAVFVAAGYINFIEIRKEIRFLEMSDTLQSESLQLRRHEKNYFLYNDRNEIREVRKYLSEINSILEDSRSSSNNTGLLRLKDKLDEYARRFNSIEIIAANFKKEFNRLKPLLSRHSDFPRLIESTFLERPLANAEILKKVLSLKTAAPAIRLLTDLGDEISAFTKNGEEILSISNALDKSAREKVEKYISMSQSAAFILFPLFLLVGIGTSFSLGHGIVKRLKILTEAIEKSGKGHFTSLEISPKQDEVGLLIKAFNKMEKDLLARDEEIRRKSDELLQSRKLAAIGTLSSGVAHELNNPLNNIYTTAQILQKELGDNCPPAIKDGLDDIYGQTMRVKRIVGELLDFARGRDPQFREFELNGLLSGAFSRLKNTMNTGNIKFILETGRPNIHIVADPVQIEQVFINLFSNAVESMSGNGTLIVNSELLNDHITVRVADTGTGIPRDSLEKIFEPFFTTRNKGAGLGLSIVFSIVQKHGGDIRVESKADKGTVFTITLPKREQ